MRLRPIPLALGVGVGAAYILGWIPAPLLLAAVVLTPIVSFTFGLVKALSGR